MKEAIKKVFEKFKSNVIINKRFFRNTNALTMVFSAVIRILLKT
jgi:hypothetical protein